MKLGRMFLKLAVVALGIFCAFLISACVRSRGNFHDALENASARSCRSCKSDGKGIKYTLNDDGESYSLSFVGKKETKVVVPAEYDGKPVTKIASGTFMYYYSGCSSGYEGLYISELTLPATITEIEEGAFINEGYDSCGKVGKLYFNGTAEQWMNITFGDSPFSGNTKLYFGGELVEELTVPESVTEIGARTFFGVGSLKKINFHDGVTKIGANAFRNCDGLTDLDIPDSVTELGDDVFYDCDGLEKVSLGAGVTKVPYRAFAGCPYLYEVKLNGTLTELGVSAFNNCKALLEIDLSTSDLTEIPDYAFFNCYNLTTFVVPESITEIGDYAFGNCEKLLEIYNLSSLNIICGSSFHGGVAYYALIVHSSLDEPSVIMQIEDFVFYNGDEKRFLKYTGEGGEITLPQLPDGENYVISNRAFYQNNKITSVTIPDTVTKIGERAFYNCDKLQSITFGYGINNIEESAFYSCDALQSVDLPANIKIVGKNTFSECSALETAHLRGVDVLGSYAFDSCENLKSVTIAGGLESIDKCTFNRCINLESITLPEGLKTICDYAFSRCAIKSLHIPSTVTEMNYGNFYNLPLESITVAAGNTVYKSAGNCLIDIENKILIKGCKNSEIPNDGSFTEIGNYAFKGTSNSSVTVPEGVIKINSYAFENSDLKSISLPSSLKFLGLGAFENCESLKTVNIKEGLQVIYSSAFMGCKSLTSIKLPKSLTNIYYHAFSGRYLKVINYSGTRAEWDSINKDSQWLDGRVWVQTTDRRFYV